jgi:uncharacterized membrane protein YgcG
MKWIFAKNNGGRDSGFHDAGVETFRGDFDRYLARELIQNSLDARLDSNKPVHVKFEMLELETSKIPDFATLTATFARCAEYWQHSEKARKFFGQAETMARRPKIRALRARDFNTTGVIGGDLERSKNWYNLVRSAGSSSKGAGEGGSFGLGKNAPFAASLLRTVLYSTFNTDGEHIFQGVSTLASHFLPDGAIGQPTGFLGGDSGESVRSRNEIPKVFLREEQGLDVTALGFPSDGNWQDGLVYSVLDNFWPAIDFGDLEVTVGTQKIDRINLRELLDAHSGDEDFTADLFYRAFKNPTNPFRVKLGGLKDVSLYLYTTDADLPKRVAMVRKTGMVIFRKQFRSILPFCGVFLCRNEQGNILLRDMEPPRHDTWDPDHPDKGANKKIEREYVDFIRQCIKKLLPLDDAKVIAVPGLNRFLPDDDESYEEPFDNGDGKISEETPNRRPLPEKIEGKGIDPQRRSMQPDRLKTEDEDDDETESENGEGTGRGEGVGGGGGAGAGGGGGGRGGGGGGGTSGGRGGSQPKPAIPVRYRTFSINPEAGVYAVTAAPQIEAEQDARIVIWTIGDDQKALAEIKGARFVSGEAIAVCGPGELGPVKLRRGEVLRIEIILQEPVRVAMEVSAHEA